MIAKGLRQNQMKHWGFTEFYRDPAGKRGRHILPETENLPFIAKTGAYFAKNHPKDLDS
jgi:hypothetical protein